MKRSILLTSVAAIALLTTGAMASDLPNTTIKPKEVTETYKPPVVQAPVQHKQKIHRGDINSAPYSDYPETNSNGYGSGVQPFRSQYAQYPQQYPRFAYGQPAFYGAIGARLPLQLVPYGGNLRYPFFQYRGFAIPHSHRHGWYGARIAPRPIAFLPYSGMSGMWQRNWQDWQSQIQTEDYKPLK